MAPLADGWSPFTFPDIWKISFLSDLELDLPDALVQPLSPDLFATKLNSLLAPSKHVDLNLKLPNLDEFEFGVPGPLARSDESDSSLEELYDTHSQDERFDDLWIIPDGLEISSKDHRLRSWESLSKPDARDHLYGLLSEAGPAAFDAALHLYAKQENSTGLSGKPIGTEVILEALWQLGFGHASAIFPYRPDSQSFNVKIEDSSVAGCSLLCSRSLFSTMSDGANLWINLRQFHEKTYNNASSSPALVALASSIRTITLVLEIQLIAERRAIRSLLQAAHHFEHAHKVLRILQELVDKVPASSTNYELILRIFRKIQLYEFANNGHDQILFPFLSAVSSPWLQLVEAALGLQLGRYQEIDRSKDWGVTFRNLFEVASDYTQDVGDSNEPDDSDSLCDDFITKRDKIVIRETGKWYRFLENHNSDHPILHFERNNIHCPTLKLEFGWEDIQRISNQAKAYEESLIQALTSFDFDSHSTPVCGANDAIPWQEFKVYGFSDDEVSRNISESMTKLNAAPSLTSPESNDFLTLAASGLLRRAEKPYLSEGTSDFRPPMALIPSLSIMPIINVQSRFVNFASLQTLFQKFHLREHLRLNHAFHLLGSGSFVSRLSTVLFESEIAGTERQRGVMRTSSSLGLRLGSGSRQSWPPATSELRLALMGVLGESWRCEGSRGTSSGDFLTHLSFGIRELPNEEIERCLNVDSVYALDFLRLQYRAPAALQEILTDSCLEKYDRVFRFFIKLLRMKFIVNLLCSQAASDWRSHNHIKKNNNRSDTVSSFRLLAHHFISTISSHFFNSAVSVPWQRFQDQLACIEEDLNGSMPKSLTSITVHELQEAHSETLDGILAGLMLRQRQQSAMRMLEEIFGDTLRFARMQQLNDTDKEKGEVTRDLAGGEEIILLHESFRAKVHEFIKTCQILGETAIGGGRSRTVAKDDASRSALQLVQLFTLNGYYAVDGPAS